MEASSAINAQASSFLIDSDRSESARRKLFSTVESTCMGLVRSSKVAPQRLKARAVATLQAPSNEASSPLSPQLEQYHVPLPRMSFTGAKGSSNTRKRKSADYPDLTLFFISDFSQICGGKIGKGERFCLLNKSVYDTETHRKPIMLI